MKENLFECEMNDIIEPYIDARCTSGYFQSYDNAKLFYKSYRLTDAKEDVVIIHGFSEFTRKYDEIIYHFLKAGCSVYIMELRGHGYSVRTTKDPCKVHIKSFEQYTGDVYYFTKKVMGNSRRPRILFAHSMGGGIGVLYTARFKGNFEKVILSSPMIQMRTGRYSLRTVMAVSRAACAVGWGEKYALGQTCFPASAGNSGETERERYYYHLRELDWHYQTWGATYGWVYASCEAAQSIEKISDLGADTLIFTAGHEIFNSDKADRDQFWKELLDFAIE